MRRIREVLGPVAAGLVLVAVAVVSVGLLGGPVPALGISRSPARLGDVPNRTPDPVRVFSPVLPARPTIPGSILFVKGGNIWTVSGSDNLQQLTTDGHEQSASWSGDGKTIYFLRIGSRQGEVPCAFIPVSGCVFASVPYTLNYPVFSRMPARGGAATSIRSSLYTWGGRYSYFYGLWQPAVSPDGKTVALITDAPDPFSLDYQLGFMPTGGGQITRARLADDYGLGHNDPAWSPDGKSVAYTYNHREGTLAQPRIALYDAATGGSRFLTTFGYAEPSFSPDGRWIVAVRRSAKGDDVVILDASTGVEQLRLTSDGRSFQPIWSPAGNQVAFLRADGLTIDLWVDSLAGSGRSFSVTRSEPLTSQSALDGTSRPSWFIPPAEMPSPTTGAGSSSAPPGSSSTQP